MAGIFAVTATDKDGVALDADGEVGGGGVRREGEGELGEERVGADMYVCV